MTTGEDQVQKAANSDTVGGDLGLFCVIGPTVNSNYGRTWKKSLEDAEAHGRKIIKKSYEGSGGKVRKLYVIQVVKVLEVDDAPPISSRSVNADDISEDD